MDRRVFLGTLAGGVLAGCTKVLRSGCATVARPDPNPNMNPDTIPMWFTSDGAATDFVNLFTDLAAWPLARRKVTAVGFHQFYLTPFPPTGPPFTWPPLPRPTPEQILAADPFRVLASQGIQIAVEVQGMSAPDWAGIGWNAIMFAKRTVDFITENGGTVAYLSTDMVKHRGAPLGLTQAQTAVEFGKWVDAMRAYVPGVKIFDTESINAGNSQEYINWINLCLSLGVRVDGFMSDTIWAVNPSATANQCRIVARHCASVGIPFHAIINPGTSSSILPTDQAYYTMALAAAQVCFAGVHPLAGIHVESWYWRGSGQPSIPINSLPKDIPANLPETGPFTHTRLLREVAAIFGIADVASKRTVPGDTSLVPCR
jgi:hypothetical protein